MKCLSHILFYMLFAAAGLMLSCGCRDSGADWTAGFASARITPDTPQWLAGYDRREKSLGVHDDIWCKVAAFSNGRDTVVIAANDVIGLFRDDVEEIRQAVDISNRCRDRIFITCTHNHSGPDLLGLWNADRSKSGVDPAYLSYVKHVIARTVEKALASLQSADLLLASTEVEGISYNGRDREITDNSVVVLQARTADRVIGTLVNFACHPEVLTGGNNLITSDYAHYMYRGLESASGGVAMLVNGALGGMLTPLVSEHSFAEAERCGTVLADAVLSALEHPTRMASADLMCRIKEMRLTLENPGFERLYRAGIVRREFQGNTVLTEVGIVRLGDLTAVSIPGEALPKIGLRLKERMSTPFKMVFGLANDELGYLIPGEDWRADAYEESMSVAGDAGDRIEAALVELIDGSSGGTGSSMQ